MVPIIMHQMRILTFNVFSKMPKPKYFENSKLNQNVEKKPKPDKELEICRREKYFCKLILINFKNCITANTNLTMFLPVLKHCIVLATGLVMTSGQPVCILFNSL